MIRVNIMETLLGLVPFLESVQRICCFSLSYCCYTDVRGGMLLVKEETVLMRSTTHAYKG